MLSLDRCRTLLGPDCRLSDAQIERLRDQIRVMAEITMNVMMVPAATTPFCESVRLLPDADDAVERAAILEFDAGMSRGRAEKMTIHQAIKRVRE